jgi:MFS family permease
MGLLNKVSEAVTHISLEPVFFLFCVNLGLIGISTQGLYLNKACLVNLNYTQEICSNIHNQTEIQKETQRFVSEIQAYNGMLQSAPAIVFTLFAGPLSDTYGRKPLIISALFGYFVLNIVFLVNSIWFFELKVTILHTIMERDFKRMPRLNTCFLSVYKT